MGDRIAMSQRERDVLKVMAGVLKGARSEAEAARLLGRSVRQVRRIKGRLELEGDGAVIHGLRGRRSNHRKPEGLRERVLGIYREEYGDFGPTLASEKLAERGLALLPETLRLWLMAEGLWERKRRRERHRRRRERRACWGELVQMDTSIHDWLEGRGERMVLVAMIDDATNGVRARFYGGETVASHFDLLSRWLEEHGRPVAVYADRDSIFQAWSKGQVDYSGQTQFERALRELDVALIRAYSPQAKGRVERLFGLAQDRWVKELRLAGVCTQAEANRVLDGRLLPAYNGRFTVRPASANDAHRPLGPEHLLEAILSVQTQRTVANDYTVRFGNRVYQLDPPIWPGLRGGKVTMEERADGRLAIRFREHYLRFREIAREDRHGVRGCGMALGDLPTTPRSLALCRPLAGRKKKDRIALTNRSSATRPSAGRSGRTPAVPYPPDGSGKLPHATTAVH